MKLLVLFVIFLSGCSEVKYQTSSFKGFESYVFNFQQEAEKRNLYVSANNLIIRFSPLDNATGMCTIYGDNLLPPTIDLDPDTWARISEPERTEVIFHEMGHCLLRRNHDGNLKLNNLPESIMYPVSFNPTPADWPGYLDELFSHINEY